MSQSEQDVRSQVREAYGKIASDFTPHQSGGCCGGGSPVPDNVAQLYRTDDIVDLPEDVTGMSLGSGDPVSLANLQEGETVLDLGSGGGIDCFLAGQRVGETGHVIGVDMTTEMIDKARANLAKVGAKNIEFRLGEIEYLPVADATVDVVISNCVINLSPNKPQVFREAFRSLKPGGRLIISDIITDSPLPDAVRTKLGNWAGCVAGALDVDSYMAGLEAAGFVDIQIERDYVERSEVEDRLEELGLGDAANDGPNMIVGLGEEVKVIKLDDVGATAVPRVFRGKVRAQKPRDA